MIPQALAFWLIDFSEKWFSLNLQLNYTCGLPPLSTKSGQSSSRVVVEIGLFTSDDLKTVHQTSSFAAQSEVSHVKS